ncbi:DUF4976 domain-containing protein [Puteibacter caeruleilacunae]|nr:DUF4976 domain-containing protein [Puteibacter caeruleilacunae]
MKTKVLLLGALSATMGVGCSSYAKTEQKETKPNIIYIMSDDHAYQAISAYGHGLNQTPNIDRIANEGVVFTNSFVTNSICAPSRAVMLTGKFSHMNGQTDNVRRFDGSQQTYPKLLQQAGYQTALVGKWHLKSDPTGFDFWSVHYDQGDYYNPDFKEMGKRTHYEGYSPNIVCDNGLNWLDKRDISKPFALLLHFKAPHRNWMPDTTRLNMYEDINFPIPATYWDNYEGRTSAACEQEMSIYKDMMIEWDLKMEGEGSEKGHTNLMKKLARMKPEERKKWDEFYARIKADFKQKNLSGKKLAMWKYQRYMRDYLKVVDAVDYNVGRVLDYLENNGLAENTIIVYTSDQGFYLGEHGWFDKRFMYEQSLRTPLLMRYPAKVKGGQKVDGMVQNIDYAPTFLDYAGVAIPEDIQGESLKPILEGSAQKVRDAIFYQYFEYPGPHAVKRHFGIRTERYKLIHFYHDVDAWELYDLKADPEEMNNLYNNAKYKATVDELKTELIELRAKYRDTDSGNKRILEEDKIALKKRLAHQAKAQMQTQK